MVRTYLDLELGLISVPDRKIEVLRGKLLAAMEQPMYEPG